MTDNFNFGSDAAGEKTEQKRSIRFPWTKLLTVIGVTALIISLFLPFVRRAGEPAHRTQCKNNLKQIALALQIYADTYGGVFPPSHTVNADGKPLHSWRTLILPYLDQKVLYQAIDLSKPWDDPVNAVAYNYKLGAFNCPSTEFPTASLTTYMAVVATNSCFLPDKPRRLSDITDGLGNTLMVIEVLPEQAVHWMSPTDVDEKLLTSFKADVKRPHSKGTHAVLADGTVRFLSNNLPESTLRSLISITENDRPGDF